MTCHIFYYVPKGPIEHELIHRTCDFASADIPLHGYLYEAEDGQWMQAHGTHRHKLLADLDDDEVPKAIRLTLLLLT